jgi:hypothetical protein
MHEEKNIIKFLSITALAVEVPILSITQIMMVISA